MQFAIDVKGFCIKSEDMPEVLMGQMKYDIRQIMYDPTKAYLAFKDEFGKTVILPRKVVLDGIFTFDT